MTQLLNINLLLKEERRKAYLVFPYVQDLNSYCYAFDYRYLVTILPFCETDHL